MKTIAFAALMILASASALPQIKDLGQSRDLAGVILDVIERFSQTIKDLGYDPLVVDQAETSIIIPAILRSAFYVEELEVVGVSNVVINDISHSLITNKLTVDLSLPEIRATLGEAGAQISVLGRPVNKALASGSLAIVNLRVIGEFSVDVDADSGVTVNDLTVNASLGGIEAGIHLNIIGYDLSRYVNHILSNLLPGVLSNNADKVNLVLEKIILVLLDLLL